jgi:AraC-like DNA-binding protein
MDALSDVLKSLRLEGAVYLNAEFTAPWCVKAEYGLASVRQRLAGAEQVVFFHYFVEGTCKVPLPGGGVLDVDAGDLVLFPHESKQLMGSDVHLKPVEAADMDPGGDADAQVIRLRHGGGGVATRVICGYIACSRSVCRPLFDALPEVLRVRMADGPAATLLRELLRTGVRESAAASPGADSMLAKVSELMFVEALRRYVQELPPGGEGWLAGVRDVYVGRALALLHGAPSKPWTVDKLAREVALSRSALAERFTALVGESPMKYLSRWRLALAAQSLRAGRDPVGRVAERAGYDSEAAFSRAFKREFGMPPARWRQSALRKALDPPARRAA